MKFGIQEQIHCIHDVSLKGSKGEDLCLGYKTSSYWIGAGIYLSDDGYVLKIKGDNSYYSFPPTDKVEALQKQELLPEPLPDYSIPFYEYAFGYSLWIVLLGVAVYTLFKDNILGKRKETQPAL